MTNRPQAIKPGQPMSNQTQSPGATARQHSQPPAQPSRPELRRIVQLFGKGHYVRLLAAADALHQRFPQDPFLRRACAAALIKLDRAEEAATLLAGAASATARDAEAATLLGLALFRSGKSQESRQALEKARRLDQRYAPAWANLGSLLASQGDSASAIRHFRRALALDPAQTETRCDYARLLLELDRKQEAHALLRAAANTPHATSQLFLLLAKVSADLLDRPGEFQAASAAVRLAPNSAEARLALGNACVATSRLNDALTQFRHILRRDSTHLGATCGVVETLAKLGRHAPAQALLTKALKRRPDALHLYSARTSLLIQRKDYDRALAAAEQAVALSPQDGNAQFNLAVTLYLLGRFDQARAVAEHGLTLNPKAPGGWYILGITRGMEGNLQQAVRCYKKGLTFQKNHPACLFGLGLVALTLGDWVSGWPLYEWRWLGSSLSLNLPRPYLPNIGWWANGPLPNIRLLVLCEQGLGDNLQFACLLKLLPQPAAVKLATEKPLLRLMRQSLTELAFPIEVIEKAAASTTTDCDAYITLLSIPARVGLTQDTLPPQTPWLKADPEETAAWRQRHGNDPRPRVGFVWRGNPGLAGDCWRSVPLTQWQPLLAQANVAWISLQKLEGPCQAERQILASHNVLDWTQEFHDFAATAALVQTLDLVIAVDTSVAHLAGGLGKPVWLLNRANSEWRWGWKQSGSIWYPSMRIINQNRLGEWQPVLKRIGRDLARWARARNTAAAGD